MKVKPNSNTRDHEEYFTKHLSCPACGGRLAHYDFGRAWTENGVAAESRKDCEICGQEIDWTDVPWPDKVVGSLNAMRLAELLRNPSCTRGCPHWNDEEDTCILNTHDGKHNSDLCLLYDDASKCIKQLIAQLEEAVSVKNAALAFIRERLNCQACKHDPKGPDDDPCCVCTSTNDRWEWEGTHAAHGAE